jgi:hypothetical protein
VARQGDGFQRLQPAAAAQRIEIRAAREQEIRALMSALRPPLARRSLRLFSANLPCLKYRQSPNKLVVVRGYRSDLLSTNFFTANVSIE